MKNSTKPTVALIALFFLSACATYDLQFDATPQPDTNPEAGVLHTFYLIGDAGNSPIGTQSSALKAMGDALKTSDKNTTVLFLGDNVYPDGLPKKNEEEREFAEHQLNVQTAIVKDIAGKAIFIPGNHDWYSEGPKGVKRQERYVEEILGNNSFLPEDGCPIRKVEINEAIELIVVDTEWYLTKWDKHPTINDDCEIRTRSRFFDEFESLIKKARGKTTIVALHNPMFTNGPHGGQYSFGQHMGPLPVLGTLKNIIRKTGGVSPQDLQNKRYDAFKDRIVTLAQENDKTIFVSGHEHSLQYLVENNIPQIISGAGSKVNPTRNVGSGKFSYGTQGYAKLLIYKDGSSKVQFFAAEEDAFVYQAAVLPADNIKIPTYDAPIPPTYTTSVYTKEETERSGFFKWFWGERYREVFSKEITVPTVKLDTMFGGLTPIRRGGGHQSNSLRLLNPEGKEYVMRAIRKNAVQYIQSVAFKEQFVRDEFTDTDTEDIVMDFFTASHPYAFLAIGELSDAVGIYHTNPELYYVPKQNAIGQYNDEYGDELYMIEERAADGHGDNYSFGYSDQLISTHDMIDKLRKDEDHIVDQKMYVRARLFDMLLGDWDRHFDQWRWAVFKENGKTIYRPVPRDRDQAFALMDDGFATGLATTLVPPIRLINSYEEELKSPKWMNLEPFPLDMAFMTQMDRKIWWDEAQYIQSQITDEVIEKAFSLLPEEVQDQYVDTIKKTLKGRRGNLTTIADEYFHIINKYGVITGTDKDDWFEIERMPKGQTKVSAFRIKGGEKADLLHERTYERSETKEIWLYGLDDKDYFLVKGKGSNLIKLRIIGGLNNDRYDIQNGNKVHVYDFKSKNNTLLTGKGRNHIRDDYDTNNYDYKRPKYNSNVLIPTFGGNPDDGLKFGLANTLTVNGFERNPFTSKHVFAANYFSST
ncbi:MAG: metallophosphoesterase, partial [Bacteroidia bacterium]|nr:metallophosphoesterase [Bacteroidia bacterium]